MDLTNKSQLLDYLKQNDLWTKKGLSQNFLIDKVALNKIVASADIKPDDLIVEIGPGLGTMTQELIALAGEVVAVEMDEKLAGLLNQKSNIKDQNEKNKIKIINEDILKVNLNEIIGERSYKVVANIPYHITSKILELFLSRENKPEAMVLLVQKEVAERICAKPGEMSVLAVSVQLYGKPEIVDIVPKESFFPSPKVDSAILRIAISKSKFQNPNKNQNQNNKNSIVSDFDIRISDLPTERDFFRLVHIGFAARRKTLINNLSAGYHISKEEASDIIKSIGLKDTVRAQELDISNWGELCRKMTRRTT